jgi:hypothetical protein
MQHTLADITGIFFISFVVMMAAGFYFKDRFQIREFCVRTLVVLVLAVNIIGIQFVPVVHLQKFGSPSEENITHHEIRIVDANGNEIVLDARAVEPVPYSRLHGVYGVWGSMLNGSNGTNDAVGRHIFTEACSYRQEIQSGPFIWKNSFQIPQHEYGEKWTAKELASYDNFTALRVYRVQKVLNEEETAFETRSETEIYELTPDKHTCS